MYVYIYIYMYDTYIFKANSSTTIQMTTRPSLILYIPAAEIGQALRATSPRCSASHPGKTKKPADGTLAKVVRSLLRNTRSVNASFVCSLLQLTPCERTSTQTAVRTRSSSPVRCISMKKLSSPVWAQRQSDSTEVPATSCRNTGQ